MYYDSFFFFFHILSFLLQCLICWGAFPGSHSKIQGYIMPFYEAGSGEGGHLRQLMAPPSNPANLLSSSLLFSPFPISLYPFSFSHVSSPLSPSQLVSFARILSPFFAVLRFLAIHSFPCAIFPFLFNFRSCYSLQHPSLNPTFNFHVSPPDHFLFPIIPPSPQVLKSDVNLQKLHVGS